MNGPITWRTVAGPSLTDASRPLDSAQRMITSGFGAFDDALKQQSAIDEQNFKIQKENNTNAFLNRLYQAQGADGMKALQDSGELQTMLSGFGAQVDQTAARTALDTRLGTLQKRDQEGWAYDNAALDQKEAPVIDQAKGLIAQGKLDEAGPIISGLSTRNQATLYNQADAKTQELLQRKWAAEKHPLEMDKLRAEINNSRTSGALNSLNLTKGKLELADLQESRDLQNTVAGAQSDYVQLRDTIGKQMGNLASQVVVDGKALPMTTSGHPDFGNMTEGQIAAYDAAATKANMPISKTLINGDTQAANDFLASLEKSGKYKASTLKKFKTDIRAGFDTYGNSGLVGNDAWERTVGNAQNKVALQEMKAQNWNAPGNPTTVTDYEALAKDVPNLIDKTDGRAPEEDVAAVQSLVYEMATRGIETKPGSGKFITPSVNDMRNAIRTAQGGWFTDAQRANKVRDILQQSMQTDVVRARIAEAEKAQKMQRKQAVAEIVGKPAP